MARRRSNSEPHLFSSIELASGVAMTQRNITLLVSMGLLPAEGAGQDAQRDFDLEGLGRAARISALYASGIGLIPAARLVAALAEDPEIGAKVFNWRPYIKIISSNEGHANWHDLHPIPNDARSDYYLHNYLFHHTDFYRPGKAIDGDKLLQIFDKRLVVSGHLNNACALSDRGQFPVFALENWGRGAEPTFTRFNDLSTKAQDELRLLKVNYTGRIIINCSLAGRNTLDRIARLRTERDS